MITGPLCKAARALVQIDRAQLAERTGVTQEEIAEFEDGFVELAPEATAKLEAALEALGAMFLPEEAEAGAGVRLKFNRMITGRIANLENEGGRTASDDVP